MRSVKFLKLPRARHLWIAVMALVTLGWGQANALSLETRVTSPIVQSNEYFGSSSALYGQTLVVGTASTRAYVYQRDTSGQWAAVATLTPSDGAAAAGFGFRVGMSGDTVLVSAYGANGGAGAVYVYVKPADGWGDMQETAKLTASGAQTSDKLGYYAAIDGDVIVATGRGTVDNRVFVYNKPTGGWASMTQSAVLTINDASADDTGLSVAIQGDTIVAGKRTANTTQGAVYAFVKPTGNWVSSSAYAAKLVASDAANADNFGMDVAVDGDTIAVGARYDDLGSFLDAGSAYVFVRPLGGWAGSPTETAKLTASDAASQDTLGWKIALQGNTVVASSHQDDLGQNNTGSAYVFIRPDSGWANMHETTKLTASAGQTLGEFSYESVAVYGNTVAVGAQKYGIDSNNNSGVVYVYSNTTDLSIVNQDDVDPVDRNAQFVYTLSVTNNDVNYDATEVTVVDTLPDAVSFVSASAGCVHDNSASGGVVTCSVASLASNGGTTAFQIRVTAGGTPGTVNNMASVSAAEVDTNSANNSDIETTSIANHAPVAANDLAEVTVNGIVSVFILENDSDADGDPLTIISVSQAAHGQVNLNNNFIKYTPNAHYTGSDSFTYTVSDPYGSQSTATVNVTVKEKPRGRHSRGGAINGLYLLMLVSVLALRRKRN